MGIIKEIIGQTILFFFNIFQNYGVAIIFTTILIKVLLFPLTLKQDKSMKAMKKIQPEIEKLKEKYGDDKEELNKKTMEMYQKYNVNPFGGCLPIIFQFPILIALFQVLRNTGEGSIIPEGSMFFIWDLTLPDPMYIFPILNGLISFLQQKLMSAGNVSNQQAKMMAYFFPVLIFVISFQMPIGLQIYWIVSSAFSIGQQYAITKMGGDETE